MKKLSIVIPVYNEAKTIAAIINKIVAVDVFGLEKEIIIIDDCSTDGSMEILEKIRQEKQLVVFHQPVNKGKGAALQLGFTHSTGDIILIQDADLEYSPDDYEIILKPILDGDADVVYGSRFMGGHPHRVLYFWHYVGNKFLTLLSNIFTNLNLTDMETCYKAFKRDLLKNFVLEEERFGFEPEFTCKIVKIPRIRVYEVGISYKGRSYAEGKKIGWKDGFRTIYCIIKYALYR